MNYNTPSMAQIIESMLEADNLPRVPKKIKVSPTTFQALQFAYDKTWIASIEDERWDSIPIEIDMDLFGYTYQLIYEESYDD